MSRSGASRRAGPRRVAPKFSPMGTLTITKRELLTTVTLAAEQAETLGSIPLVCGSFPYLKGLSASFDRVVFRKMHLWFKPAVGTTYPGRVSMGVDWDFKSKPTERKQLAGFTPTATAAAWEDTEKAQMVLPRSSLQSRTFYSTSGPKTEYVDQGPGMLHWGVSGKEDPKIATISEIWAEYTVTLSGTNFA